MFALLHQHPIWVYHACNNWKTSDWKRASKRCLKKPRTDLSSNGKNRALYEDAWNYCALWNDKHDILSQVGSNRTFSLKRCFKHTKIWIPSGWGVWNRMLDSLGLSKSPKQVALEELWENWCVKRKTLVEEANVLLASLMKRHLPFCLVDRTVALFSILPRKILKELKPNSGCNAHSATDSAVIR